LPGYLHFLILKLSSSFALSHENPTFAAPQPKLNNYPVILAAGRGNRNLIFLPKNRDHEQLRIDGDFYPCAI
jgi:hypothetical protein